MPKLYKVFDPSDSFHKVMPHFDLPFRTMLCSKSQHGIGKTTIILNLLMNPEFKMNELFEGKNIFVISNNKLDNKLKLLKEFKEIPDENFMPYDESDLNNLYDEIELEFLKEKAEGDIPNRLMIFDDVGYSSDFKKKGIIDKIISQGRHLNVSQLYSVQKMSMCSTILRSQLTSAFFGSCSARELDSIEQDFNYLNDKKSFNNMFRKATSAPRGFLLCNFTGKNGLYYDSDFKPIKV